MRFRSARFILLPLALLAGCERRPISEPPPEEPPPEELVEPAPTAPPPLTPCEPTAGGPHWVLEGEPLTFTVRCASGLELPGEAFVMPDLPDGATFDADTATFHWTPKLDQAASYELPLGVPDRNESTTVAVGVLDRFRDRDNVPVADPLRYPEEYGLPVYHLSLSGQPNEETYVEAELVLRGRRYHLEVKRRGRSSLEYPKASYTLKFGSQQLLSHDGLLNPRRLALVSTFDDASFVRQRLAYALWSRMDPAHLQLRTESAVVFLNGEYLGLYLVVDHIDEYLMAANGLNGFGNLYKAVSKSADFSSASNLETRFDKKAGTPAMGEPGAYQDLEELIRFISSASESRFAKELSSWIDVRDYQDWLVFVTLLRADDSVNKNAYHYHDPNGGPWRFLPWDLNESFGQSYSTKRQGPKLKDYSGDNFLFQRLTGEETFASQIRERFHELLDGALRLEAVLPAFDAMVSEVAPSAQRDLEKWGRAYRGHWGTRPDFEGECEYVRQWIIDRWTHQRSQP